MSNLKKYRITQVGGSHSRRENGKMVRYRGPRLDGSLREGFPNIIELTQEQAESLAFRHLRLVPVDLAGEAA